MVERKKPFACCSYRSGVFGRLLWRQRFATTLLVGFAASLFIELAQLTANFGTAPFAYRIFDVDDLINNTTGAALGWIACTLYVTLRASARQQGASSPVASRQTIAPDRVA